MVYAARNLRRRYLCGESQIQAIDGLDLSIGAGEHIAIAGPSGSGKTTLLHILGLLDGDFEGELSFLGQDMRRAGASARARLRLQQIGLVYQGAHLLTALNVRDNVALSHWRLHGNRARALATAEKWLGELGMEHRLLHRVNRLSAGEMQRAAIARALINDPAVVLADEPTGNQDAVNAAAIAKFFARIPAQGRTLIVITHDPEVQRAAARVLHLRYGKLSDGEMGDPCTT